MNKLVIIDGNAIMHRAYHALPPLTTKSGEPINAVYGFVSMLLGLINDLKPTHLAVCFDRPEKTFRREKYVYYQAQRPEMDEFLTSQIAKIHDVLDSFGIPVYEKAGYEADDVIGTLSKQAVTYKKSKINEVVIITGDRDIFQLINKKVKVYVPVKGLKDGKLYDVDEVEHEFGFKPIQIIDYKALVGDSSDNYPGVPGIGPKTTINLISKYKTKDNIYKHLDEIVGKTKEKLEKGKDMADMSHDLATIHIDVPIKIDFLKMKKWDLGSEDAIKLFISYGFKTLTNRIMGKSADPEIILGLKKNLSKTDIEEVALLIAKNFKNTKYAIRGTASLVLQGLDMGVDDIDILADKKTSLMFNDVFKKEKLDEVKYSETDKFKSYYGKFAIRGTLVEVMGVWEIKTDKGWSGIYDASDDEVEWIKVQSENIRVTKLELELKVAGEMGRWNEFHKIKKQLSITQQGSLF